MSSAARALSAVALGVALAAALFATVLWALGTTEASFDPVAWNGLVLTVLGAAILRTRPHNPLGWVLLSGVSLSLSGGLSSYADAAYSRGWPGVAWAEFGGGLLATPTLHVVIGCALLLFPDGARRPWRVWMSRAAVAGAAAFVLAGALGSAGSDFPGVEPISPVGWSGAETLLWGVVPVLTGFAGGLVAVVVDRGRATGLERRRYDWLVLGGLSTALGFGFVALGDGWIDGVGAAVLAISFPASLTVAITRHRLYDIDRVVSRTATYVLSSLTLASLYAAVVLVTQAVVGGGRGTPDVVVAAATLAVAALFGPLRRRIQARVDRRFARSRYDAAALVAGFAARLRGTVALEEISAELAAVAHRAFAPASASLVLLGVPRAESRSGRGT